MMAAKMLPTKKYRIIRKIMTVLSESINRMKDMEEQSFGDIVTQ